VHHVGIFSMVVKCSYMLWGNGKLWGVMVWTGFM